MIVDTSALVAIAYQVPEASLFTEMILGADRTLLSIANFLEFAMVIEKQTSVSGARSLDTLIRRLGLTLEPITVKQGHIARQAFLEYGKGRHRAALNYSDCFAYELAKAIREPLLYKGDDFRRKDVMAAH